MIEALVAFGISAIGFFIGYGKLVERIKSNKELMEHRLSFMQEQIDTVDKKNEDLTKVLQDISIKLNTVAVECSFIKGTLVKIESKIENLS